MEDLEGIARTFSFFLSEMGGNGRFYGEYLMYWKDYSESWGWELKARIKLEDFYGYLGKGDSVSD